ncbi:hypothetical protein ACFTXO_08260 [Streptomyces sp. NPDC057067]|uniref:hypothetical protein n=1 Tax=unclassified Streptomyces TaxID=2593676 RepID=UPI00362F8D44
MPSSLSMNSGAPWASFKAHFWAGERGESVRDHADPQVRELDALLLELVWGGLDGEAQHTDPARVPPWNTGQDPQLYAVDQLPPRPDRGRPALVASVATARP